MTLHSVALYGFAPHSRDGIHQSKADEIWSIVWAYHYDVPRIDRLLEIHPVWLQARNPGPEFAKVREHWEWLKNNQTIPVYMMAKRPEVPKSIAYPLQEAMSLVPPSRQKKVFTSSFDYLMALALLEGAERIELYGFEMGSDTEYRYQREGAAYWIAQCDARGVELVLPSNTALLKNKLYGYEGGSMIYRQSVESRLAVRQQQKVEFFAKLSFLEGKLHTDPTNEELQERWDSQYRLCMVVSGMVQELEKMLKEIDLEEPDNEVIDPAGRVALEAQ